MNDFVVIWLNPTYCSGVNFNKYHNVANYTTNLRRISFNLLMSPIEFDFHIRNSAKYCNLDEKLKLMIEISQFCSRHFKFWTHSSLRPLKSHSKRSHLEPRSVFYPEGNVLVF